MDDLQKKRMALNEARFRDVNGSIANGIDRFMAGDSDLAYTLLCECAVEACAEMLSVTHAEYRDVRAHPTRFMVCDGHVEPEIEHVVAQNDRLWIVEKHGVGAAVARERS